eukprot:GHVQ01038425.1.p1 GENE.GHVQ01038425.1~~GHVQ01038425.1.p1  ORF type:complete len:254 (+),score=10.31 GHVQ01038425.1:400-1161(+)
MCLCVCLRACIYICGTYTLRGLGPDQPLAYYCYHQRENGSLEILSGVYDDFEGSDPRNETFSAEFQAKCSENTSRLRTMLSNFVSCAKSLFNGTTCQDSISADAPFEPRFCTGYVPHDCCPTNDPEVQEFIKSPLVHKVCEGGNNTLKLYMVETITGPDSALNATTNAVSRGSALDTTTNAASIAALADSTDVMTVMLWIGFGVCVMILVGAFLVYKRSWVRRVFGRAQSHRRAGEEAEEEPLGGGDPEKAGK